MQIAFYAPMKPPTSPRPSGDRLMARLLMSALKYAGHEVSLASKFRSWNGKGEENTQKMLEKRAESVVKRLSRQYLIKNSGFKPDIWFTYHLYYKAPDLIGPKISKLLKIPYVVAEASHAPKRAKGNWARGHLAAEKAIRQADHIIALNPADIPCVKPLLRKSASMTNLRPFLPSKNGLSGENAYSVRQQFLGAYGLDPTKKTLITVAMMRDGDKLASYNVLCQALRQMVNQSYQLLVVGDGGARQAVEREFAPLGSERVRFLGALSGKDVATALSASDIFLWPAVNEAYGMAILEAQAAGLPVIAGDSGGVGQIIRDGKTGILTKEGNIKDFTNAIELLLADSNRCLAMGEAAKLNTDKDHSLEQAAKILDSILIESKKGKVQ